MRWFLIKRNLLACLVVLLLPVVYASAQTGTTSVRGAVSDKTGATIVGAKVSITNVAQALQRETATDGSGAYEFLSLPPGGYVLAIEAKGFRKFEQKNLQLLVNSPATVNATLEVGATTEIVEVSAQAVALNTTDASLGSAFSENQVKELPNNVNRDSLEPILKEMGRDEAGTRFYIFRRFREARLQKSELRQILIDFWMAHSNPSMGDRYGKQLVEDVEYRQREVAKISLGFELPPTLLGLRGLQNGENGVAAKAA